MAEASVKQVGDYVRSHLCVEIQTHLRDVFGASVSHLYRIYCVRDKGSGRRASRPPNALELTPAASAAVVS